ncbi:hypothetical protein [Burkholderia sp. LMG 32019]|uniref:hypothetical protein n=1 Tax=Burkholderia sp. LMG 32019 TaxID=3158173 RepID=UPI003C2CE122
MQAICFRLGKIEEHARSIAIGCTGVIVLIALALPYVERLAPLYMSQAGVQEVQLVMAPEYRVFIDGHATSIVGTDECPREEGPQKAYWLGGRPEEIPPMGCVVVGPSTKEVRVQVIGGASEAWEVVRRERDDLPETLLKRPNGEYVAQAK